MPQYRHDHPDDRNRHRKLRAADELQRFSEPPLVLYVPYLRFIRAIFPLSRFKFYKTQKHSDTVSFAVVELEIMPRQVMVVMLTLEHELHVMIEPK